MKSVAELVLSLCDLLEAEGRQLKKNVKSTGTGCGIIAIGLIFILASLAFATAAIYSVLITAMSSPLALLLMAGVSLIFAGLILWIAKALQKKK